MNKPRVIYKLFAFVFKAIMSSFTKSEWDK